MFDEFMDSGMLTTFIGLTTAVTVIVQFTKTLVKRKFGDALVRVYAFVISLLLTLIFSKESFSLQGIIIWIINAMLITMASMGGYEVLSDPKAQKR